jgi:small subunit ribosomal protein S1
LTADPWTTVGERYAVGQVHQGRVTRVAPFGAFVEIEPGVEALAHVSTFPPSGRRDGWMQEVPAGAIAAFEVLSIDLDQKRMGVALVPDGTTRAASALSAPGVLAPGVRVTGKVERHERFGVFVFLGPGRTALMPMSETGVDRDADLAKAFPIGSDIEVIVLEAEPSGRRISVSRKAVFEAEERAELREYAARQEAPPPEKLGSLADKLKGAWKR